jgi:lipoate-protein ligase A
VTVGAPPPEAAAVLPALFDAEAVRALARPTVFVRSVERLTLVLGSTQALSVVDRAAAVTAGVELRRRRSGGGLVLLRPQAQLWLDLWIPRTGGHLSDDVGATAAWVGERWSAALDRLGLRMDTSVHHGRLRPSPWSAVICFAGVGPGEVLVEGRKLVGVAQWRSRQGVLVHSMALQVADWPALLELAALEPSRRREAVAALGSSTVDLAGLLPGATVRDLEAALVEPLVAAGWELGSG